MSHCPVLYSSCATKSGCLSQTNTNNPKWNSCKWKFALLNHQNCRWKSICKTKAQTFMDEVMFYGLMHVTSLSDYPPDVIATSSQIKCIVTLSILYIVWTMLEALQDVRTVMCLFLLGSTTGAPPCDCSRFVHSSRCTIRDQLWPPRAHIIGVRTHT